MASHTPELFSGFGLVAKEVSFMMVEIRRLLVVALAVLACVCMWGCGDWFEPDTHYEWDKHRQGKKVVGFLNDSLVIVSDYRFWREVRDDNDDEVANGFGRQALYLYNYRVQESSPRWMDSLDNGIRNDDFEMINGQLSDSVVWAHKGGSLWLWKIGETPRQIKINEKYDGCSHEIRSWRMREWIDGQIIVLGETTSMDSNHYIIWNALSTVDSSEAYCQYAVLDTVSKTLIYKRLDDGLKWIGKCDDVRSRGNDVYCSMSGERSLGGVILKNEIDTLSVPLLFGKGMFWGNMIELRASICLLGEAKVSCVDTAYTWREPLKFYKNDEVVVDLNL